MSDERKVRLAHEGIAPDRARDLRASAWRFIFDCYAKKKAAHPGGPDDAEDLEHDRTTNTNYTR
jgi:hypothetical protein